MTKFRSYPCPLCKGEKMMHLKERKEKIKGRRFSKLGMKIEGGWASKFVMECEGTPQHYLTLSLFNRWRDEKDKEMTRVRVKSIMQEQAKAEQDGRLRKWFG